MNTDGYNDLDVSDEENFYEPVNVFGCPNDKLKLLKFALTIANGTNRRMYGLADNRIVSVWWTTKIFSKRHIFNDIIHGELMTLE